LVSTLGKVLPRGQVTLPHEIRCATGIKPGDVVRFRATGPDTIEIRVLPRLTAAELFEEFRIDGPIDFEKDREEWEAKAAEDIFGERRF
jgi:AbrB family looped-hinge helix DNA binding protein